MIGAVIREKRQAARLTQPALARRAGLSESLLRCIETGNKNASPDIASAIASALHAPEVCFARCQDCPSNWLSVVVLSDDQHPDREILVALRETREVIEAVQGLADVRPGRADTRLVERACDQMLDLVPLTAAAVTAWCREYGLDMRQVARKHRAKLEQRGHLRREEAAA